jgi:uncharacterized membrane protein
VKKRLISVLILSAVGIGISGYLTLVDMFGTNLYCVEGFSCSEVLASVYSRILGVPISLLGLLMYFALLTIVLTCLFFRISNYILLVGGLALSLAGTLFSAYLTFIVEAMILGKFCFWCLTSAVTITAIAVLFISMVRHLSKKNDWSS